MNNAIYRAIYSKLSTDVTLLGYLGLTAESTDAEKFEKFLKRIPTEYINLPRVLVLASVYSRPHLDIRFFDKKIVQIRVQTKDSTGSLNFKILSRIRELLDGETPQILSTDNISYWDMFEWEREDQAEVLHSDVYDYFNEYCITCAPRVNKKLLRETS